MTLSTKPLAGTRFLGRAALALALAGTVATATTQSADAFTYSNSGRAGSIRVPAVTGSHFGILGGFVPWILTQGMVVNRSPATTGSQAVRASYRVYHYTGTAWAYVTGSSAYATIAAGAARVTLPTWSVTPTSGKGYYYVATTVTWRSNGVLLGSTGISWNQSGDYQCQTSFPCTAGPGWIYIG